MKYLAINIGPIVKTFSIARKPKEFWAASYMFSYLMQCILESFDKERNKVELISPHYENQRIGVGLFPDRAFYLMKEEVDVKKLTGTSDMKKVMDLKGNPLLLFINSWSIGMTLDRNEGLRLAEFSRN